MNRTLEDMQQDLAWTLADKERLSAIVENIRKFIEEPGAEIRTSFRVDLMKWESLLNQAKEFEGVIRYAMEQHQLQRPESET